MTGIGQLFKMDYSAVSQAAKRFEQESKINQKETGDGSLFLFKSGFINDDILTLNNFVLFLRKMRILKNGRVQSFIYFSKIKDF